MDEKHKRGWAFWGYAVVYALTAVAYFALFPVAGPVADSIRDWLIALFLMILLPIMMIYKSRGELPKK